MSEANDAAWCEALVEAAGVEPVPGHFTHGDGERLPRIGLDSPRNVLPSPSPGALRSPLEPPQSGRHWGDGGTFQTPSDGHCLLDPTGARRVFTGTSARRGLSGPLAGHFRFPPRPVADSRRNSRRKAFGDSCTQPPDESALARGLGSRPGPLPWPTLSPTLHLCTGPVASGALPLTAWPRSTSRLSSRSTTIGSPHATGTGGWRMSGRDPSLSLPRHIAQAP